MKGSRPEQAVLSRDTDMSKTEDTRRVIEDMVDGLNDHRIADIGEFFSEGFRWLGNTGCGIDPLNHPVQKAAPAQVQQPLVTAAHAPRLSRLGGMLLNELHMHHQVEDFHYFPKLSGLAPEIGHGFDLLEADHQLIDPMLHDLARAMNGVLQGQGAVTALEAELVRFERLLERHLTDEEDLVVPVILKTGFQG